MTVPAFGCAIATSRFLSVNGLRLHLLEWSAPERPTILFLHGGSAHAHWFDAVVEPLAGRFHLLSLDQRGHGESQWPAPPAYATENFAADILAVLDALGVDRVVLVGHSMGGHNSMAFAAWHPARVRGVVIVDSRPTIPEDRLSRLRTRGRRSLRRHPTLDAALASFRLLPPETVADPSLLEHLGRAGIAQRDGAWMYRFDPDANGQRRPVDAWRLLDRIAAPTLIVRGEKSPILPRPMAEDMRARIPRASVAEIPGAYHHLVLDAPRPFTALLEPFLETVG